MSALSHLSTPVPLWGLFANALLYFVYRESSRVICLHARQGMLFHLLLALAFLAKYLADLLASLAAVIHTSGAIKERVDVFGRYALTAFWAVFALVCLAGAVQALRGRVFAYPLLGKRLLRNYIASARRSP